MTGPLLQLKNVNTHYGPIHILQDVNIELHEVEIAGLLGGISCGKSSKVKTVLGSVTSCRGVVIFCGERVNQRLASYRVARGLAVVPENSRIFGTMTVLMNLQMGAYLRDDTAAVRED